MNGYKEQILCDGVECAIDESGLEKLIINNAYASAVIHLQGAHVTSFIPRGQQDVLWLSQSANFSAGKAIRGGIPLCWPWFGAHPSDSKAPAHGFARTSVWRLMAVNDMQEQGTQVHLQFRDTEQTRQLWPFAFILDCHITIGNCLKVSLTTHNLSDQAMVISEAIHSYFSLADISKVKVEGLSAATYIDKLNNNKVIEQLGDVVVTEAVDRIYTHSSERQKIVDAKMGRQIELSKSGACDTVVWNPWAETAKNMADFDDLGFTQMLCVEAANSQSNSVVIEPSQQHQVTQTIALK